MTPGSPWTGTHPALAAELKKHEQTMAAQIAQAQRVCQLQKTNIENLYEFEKKQADDEHKVQGLSPAAPTSKAWH
jgi:hypothetical protein